MVGRGEASREEEALAELTVYLNQARSDGRPSFVAFDAEFPGIESRADWMEHLCLRCGLAHLRTGTTVTLALMRYRVKTVIDAYRSGGRASPVVFAAPTVLDQPFYNIFHPAPAGIDRGHAVPLDGGTSLVGEAIHARIDYTAEHWVCVGQLKADRVDDKNILTLRTAHLANLRTKAWRPDYGEAC